MGAQVPGISPLIVSVYDGGETPCMETIGARIRRLRKAKGLTQMQLAALVGVNQSAISQIESGDTQSLAGETLAGLARALDVTADYILWGGEGGPDQARALLRAELSRIAESIPTPVLEGLLNFARGALLRSSSVIPLDAPAPIVQSLVRPLKRKSHGEVEIRKDVHAGRRVRQATKRASGSGLVRARSKGHGTKTK